MDKNTIVDTQRPPFVNTLSLISGSVKNLFKKKNNYKIYQLTLHLGETENMISW